MVEAAATTTFNTYSIDYYKFLTFDPKKLPQKLPRIKIGCTVKLPKRPHRVLLLRRRRRRGVAGTFPEASGYPAEDSPISALPLPTVTRPLAASNCSRLGETFSLLPSQAAPSRLRSLLPIGE
jgi:hypothetical protein